MIFLPYSTALTLGRPPYVSYAAVTLCVLVYTLQLGAPITESLAYYPDTWNPIKMISSSLAHADFWHLFGNLVFYMAFAPALEILLGNWIRYVGVMLFVAFAVHVSYSLSVVIGGGEPIPTLGFSGVVFGMIGLSAYLMPRARIRVFCWFIAFWTTVFVPAWILAAIYIGLDAWAMFTLDDYGGINLVAHVSGGLAGYIYGLLWLGDRREETRGELAEEIEAMRIEQRYGKTRAEAHRYRKAIDPILEDKARAREFDKFMGGVYRMVKTGRDSEAILELLNRYDTSTLFTELEPVLERVAEWGPSRTALCLGRLMVEILGRELRHGRVLMLIQRCQAISPQFVLPNVSKTLFYAQMALDTGKPEIARDLLADAGRRYAGIVDADQANHVYQQALGLLR